MRCGDAWPARSGDPEWSSVATICRTDSAFWPNAIRKIIVRHLGVFVRTGSRDETLEIGGVSHFLEHMVFKGTPQLHGGASQFATGRDGLAQQRANLRRQHDLPRRVLPEFQTPIVELLCNLMRPSLRESDFETEKKVIVEEIMMYDDQPPYGGYERAMAEYFGDHPLRPQRIGHGAIRPRLDPGNKCAIIFAAAIARTTWPS